MHNTVPKPNLFILGAAKCGTTSLHAYLDLHPDVFMSEPKEPSFFVPERKHLPKELEWYQGLFKGAEKARIVGESSTDYTKRPFFEGVPDRIAAFAPDARFIYMMRDPIRRAISHYWHDARQYFQDLPMLEAMQATEKYTSAGDYAFQLEAYFSRFPRDRFLFLTFESFVLDTVGTLDDVFRWLGVDPIARSLDLTVENATPEVVALARGKGRLNRFRRSKFWSVVSPMVPRALKEVGRGAALEARRPKEEPEDEVISHLLPWAQETVDSIENLLGREFPEWTTSKRGEALNE
jgi:hypothetical protein